MAHKLEEDRLVAQKTEQLAKTRQKLTETLDGIRKANGKSSQGNKTAVEGRLRAAVGQIHAIELLQKDLLVPVDTQGLRTQWLTARNIAASTMSLVMGDFDTVLTEKIAAKAKKRQSV